MQENVQPDAGGRFGTSPIQQVREGMRVVDAGGEQVGTVEYVHFGDPQAATVDTASAVQPGGLAQAIGEVFAPDEAEPDLPEPLRSRYLRHGFIKVDGGGIPGFETDRYARAEEIAAVSGDTVALRVHRDELAKEQ